MQNDKEKLAKGTCRADNGTGTGNFELLWSFLNLIIPVVSKEAQLQPPASPFSANMTDTERMEETKLHPVIQLRKRKRHEKQEIRAKR